MQGTNVQQATAMNSNGKRLPVYCTNAVKEAVAELIRYLSTRQLSRSAIPDGRYL